MNIKKVWFVLLLFTCCFFFSQNIWASETEETRVYDRAGLFTEAEKKQLEEQIRETKEQIHMDLAVLTVQEAKGKGPVDVADDFYEAQDLGIGTDHSGALYLIDMDNRQLYLSTEGKMVRYLTDARIEKILDRAIEAMESGTYASGAKAAIEEIQRMVKAGVEEGQYHYNELTGETDPYRKRRLTGTEILFSIAAAGSLAGFTCLSTVNRYKMKRQHKQALNYHMAYRGNSNFIFDQSNDQFINKMVSRRLIPKIQTGTGGGSSSGGGSSGRSTVHHSSSGRTHGGGGRSF